MTMSDDRVTESQLDEWEALCEAATDGPLECASTDGTVPLGIKVEDHDPFHRRYCWTEALWTYNDRELAKRGIRLVPPAADEGGSDV